MILLIFSVAVGAVLGFLVPVHISPEYTPYVAVAILAAIDSVFGGIAANYQKMFNIQVFLSGFLCNACLAGLFTAFGNLLDVDLYLAAVVVFGTRLFQNLATIRRYMINEWVTKRERKSEQNAGL